MKIDDRDKYVIHFCTQSISFIKDRLSSVSQIFREALSRIMAKICLLLLPLVVITLAVFASADNNEYTSLMNGIVSSRVIRSAEPEAGIKKKKKIKGVKALKKRKKKAKRTLKKVEKKRNNRNNKAEKRQGRNANRKVKKTKNQESKRRKVRKNKKRKNKKKKYKKRKNRKKDGPKQGHLKYSGLKTGSQKNESCFDDVVQSIKEFKKAQNHLRMAKRVSSWAGTRARKNEKAASVFQETLEALNTSCVSSTDENTTAALATLSNCSISAAAACDPSTLNTSNVESCSTTLKDQIDAFDVS